MKRLLAALLVLIATLHLNAAQKPYLAAGDKLTAYKVDSTTGQLKPPQALELEGAGPFTRSPDGTRLYIVSAKSRNPTLTTLDFSSDGKLKLLYTAPAHLRDGYLKVDSTGNLNRVARYDVGSRPTWVEVHDLDP
ncbi:MAG: hypothetical protein CMO80_00465 [Verrucomicrobiales bacterium]|nr:hypothetical protein [Verrucomicrobiales bacterium]|tara:strand:- start:57 stop:461 length:405 start_codon:yes stop_codon:yes gene_type:complete